MPGSVDGGWMRKGQNECWHLFSYFFIGMVYKCEHAFVEVRQPARAGWFSLCTRGPWGLNSSLQAVILTDQAT